MGNEREIDGFNGVKLDTDGKKYVNIKWVGSDIFHWESCADPEVSVAFKKYQKMINDVAADDESGNGKNETEATVSKNVTMDVDDDVRKSGDGTSEEESADEGTAVGNVKGDDPSESILLSESDEELFEPAAKRPKIEELKKRISPRLNPDQSNAVDKNETDNEVMHAYSDDGKQNYNVKVAKAKKSIDLVLSQVAGMSPDAEADKAAEKSPEVTEGMDAGGSVKIAIEMSSAMKKKNGGKSVEEKGQRVTRASTQTVHASPEKKVGENSKHLQQLAESTPIRRVKAQKQTESTPVRRVKAEEQLSRNASDSYATESEDEYDRLTRKRPTSEMAPIADSKAKQPPKIVENKKSESEDEFDKPLGKRPTKEMAPSARADENKSSESSGSETATKRRSGRPKGNQLYSLDLNKEKKKGGNTDDQRRKETATESVQNVDRQPAKPESDNAVMVTAESEGTPKDASPKCPAPRQLNFELSEIAKSSKEAAEGPKLQHVQLNEKMEVLLTGLKAPNISAPLVSSPPNSDINEVNKVTSDHAEPEAGTTKKAKSFKMNQNTTFARARKRTQSTMEREEKPRAKKASPKAATPPKDKATNEVASNEAQPNVAKQNVVDPKVALNIPAVPTISSDIDEVNKITSDDAEPEVPASKKEKSSKNTSFARTRKQSTMEREEKLPAQKKSPRTVTPPKDKSSTNTTDVVTLNATQSNVVDPKVVIPKVVTPKAATPRALSPKVVILNAPEPNAATPNAAEPNSGGRFTGRSSRLQKRAQSAIDRRSLDTPVRVTRSRVANTPVSHTPKQRVTKKSFVVDRLVEHKKNDSDDDMFLVRWEGYEPNYDSWEPAINLPQPVICDYFVAKVNELQTVVEELTERLA